VPIKENPSGIGSSNAFVALTEPQQIDAAYVATTAAPTQTQTHPHPCVSDEIPQGYLPSHPVLELASLVDDVHVDVRSDDVERVSPKSREELEVPRIQDALVTHPFSNAHDDEHSLIVDLQTSTYAREVSPPQHCVAHDDVQTSPQDSPLVVRSISDDTATFLEMERLAQHNYTVEQTETDENGDRILTIYEPHSNPNVQHDLDLWMRVRDYDKANAEKPFTPYDIAVSKYCDYHFHNDSCTFSIVL